MKIKFLTAILVFTALLSACQQQEKQDVDTAEASSIAIGATVEKPADAIAKVNGKYISRAMLDALKTEISRSMPGQAYPEQQLIEDLIRREVLVQEALKNKLDQTPGFATRVDVVRQSMLSQSIIHDFMNKNAVTDAELQAMYDKEAKKGGIEFKARHILLKTEAEAKDVITKLDQGEAFVELAKTLSTGPSGPKGGDLGWFAPKRMVPAFSAALLKMKRGEYSNVPVQTNFGWHIILLEDTRKTPVPKFEEVKAKLLPVLQRQKVQAYVTQLHEQAEIEILAPEAVTTPEPAPVATAVTETSPESGATDTAQATVQEVTETAKPTE